MSIERTRRLAAAGVVAVMALAGCGPSAATSPPTNSQTVLQRPASTAILTILSPTNGQVVHGSSVVLRLSLQHAHIVPATTSHVVPDEGHIHVLVNQKLVSMTFGLTQVVPGLPSGQVVLHVEFVASDHAPFDPQVFTDVVIEVKR